MNVEAIQALGAQDEVAPLFQSGTGASAAGPGAGFSQHVLDGLQEVNKQLLASQVDLQRLASGDAENLHDIMVRLEEGRIALQLGLQVRNRLLEAYQDVMRMQI